MNSQSEESSVNGLHCKILENVNIIAALVTCIEYVSLPGDIYVLSWNTMFFKLLQNLVYFLLVTHVNVLLTYNASGPTRVTA